ncbi:hypothetical protein PRZ48_006559 [Zasmidium cellare]|uniref:BTB domain-containing protein n=1 Tax=Zasmidium cellare TaxID=395010 RepID=A0ABR0ENE9_ZASCE|nr:hypothetical protein PRZ48_006559 [Zasmidium cellare]
MAQAPDEMAIGVANLLTNPQFSDFSLELGDHTWDLHRIVLSTQSSFFARAFKAVEEAPGEGIDLPVQHEEVVDAMLQYLYTSDYSATTTSYGKPYALAPIVLDVLLYTLAIAVDVAPLMEMASLNFRRRCETDWATPGFPRAIRELYEIPLSFTQLMRGSVIHVATRNSTALLRTQYGADFRAVLKEVKAFAADIQRASNEWNEKGKRPS